MGDHLGIVGLIPALAGHRTVEVVEAYLDLAHVFAQCAHVAADGTQVFEHEIGFGRHETIPRSQRTVSQGGKSTFAWPLTPPLAAG